MIIKALLDLKQEVDKLKAVVYGQQGDTRSLPSPSHLDDGGVEQAAEEAEARILRKPRTQPHCPRACAQEH